MTDRGETFDYVVVGGGGCRRDYRAALNMETCSLGEVQEAYREVAGGSAGRVVLHPQECPDPSYQIDADFNLTPEVMQKLPRHGQFVVPAEGRDA
jgi:hypothetical protein